MLGPQTQALFTTSKDPLERTLRGSTFTMGADRYTKSLDNAIDAFVHREYPYLVDPTKQQGLQIVPSLPTADGDISVEELTRHCISERLGGLLEGKRAL